MVSAWGWVFLAGVTAGNGSAFDPKGYIQAIPVEEDDADDVLNDGDDAAPSTKSPVVAETAVAGVMKADVVVEGKPFVALKSSFGTIYVAHGSALDAKHLARATCASRKPLPSVAGPGKALTGDDATHERDILKAIEARCK